MASERLLQQGDIYWVEDLEPLHGDREKSRPVVIVSPPQHLLSRPSTVLVVVVSSSAIDADRVLLPNREDDPRQQVTSLPRRCWAVPRWFRFVEVQALVSHSGRLRKVTLDQVLQAVRVRISEAAARKGKGS